MGVRPRSIRLVAWLAGGGFAWNLIALVRAIRRAAAHDHPLVHHALVRDDLDGPPLTLVVLGDSAAAGFGITDPALAYPHQLALRVAERRGAPVEVHCLAVRGYRTIHVLERQVPHLAELAPDVVVVGAGVNDVLGRRTTSQVEHDTTALIEGIRQAAPDAGLVLSGAADLRGAPSLPWPTALGVGARCKVVADAQRRVCERLGVAFTSIPYEVAAPHLYGPDGFHPGVEAHAIGAELTIAALYPDTPDEESTRGPAATRQGLHRVWRHERAGSRNGPGARR